MPDHSITLPIFPLNTVLFPGGSLPLRIFEQRYLAMTKACLRDGTGFGVCLISEGSEVGKPALPTEVGCLAIIDQWEMPQLGVFHIKAHGRERFRLLSTVVKADGLTVGEAVLLDPEPSAPVASRHLPCVEILEQVVGKFGAAHFPEPHRFDDASWVSYRLAEILPLDLLEKQRWLVSNDAEGRLDRILDVISRG